MPRKWHNAALKAATLAVLFPLLAHAGQHSDSACQQPPPASIAATGPRASLVLIIDDLGLNLDRGMAIVELPGKLNLAMLPHRTHTKTLAEAGHLADKEILLHAPMSNIKHMSLGKGGLTPQMSRQEFDNTLRAGIADIPHIKGVNNHMGSELTQQPQQMGWLMQILVRKGLYFVDSRTSAETVAAQTATAYSVPNLSRSVFLDNERTAQAIDERFKTLLKRAETDGLAVGIGHPYPETAAYLKKALPYLKCRGVALKWASEAVTLETGS